MGAAISIDNGGPLDGTFDWHVDQIDVSTALGTTRPDPGWEFVDAAGHFHAYTDTDGLPTLERVGEFVAYDEPDDETGETGYTLERWRCRICGEVVEPGRVTEHPGGQRAFAPGRMSWSVTVPAYMLAVRVSVRIERGDRVYFGVAEVVSAAVVDGAASTLVGIGELGQRKARKPVSR